MKHTKSFFTIIAFFASFSLFAQVTIQPQQKRKSRADELTAWDAIDYLQKKAPHLLKFEVPLNVYTDTIIIRDTVFTGGADDASWFFPEVAIPGKDTVTRFIRDTVKITVKVIQRRTDTIFVRDTLRVIQPTNVAPDAQGAVADSFSTSLSNITVEKSTFDLSKALRYVSMIIVVSLGALIFWYWYTKKE